MNLAIENIGTVKKADIQFNGLAVIAGENDSGKSTVGKLLFSIVKAINRYEQDLSENKSQTVKKQLEKLYFKIRNSVNFLKEEKVKNEFHPGYFAKQLEPYLSKQPTLFAWDHSDEISQLFARKLACFEHLDEETEAFTRKALDEIKHSILQEERKEDLIKRALSKVFFSEFYFELSTKGSPFPSTIKFSEGENKIFDIEIKENSIASFVLHDALSFNDVTFVETPVVLQMYDVISFAETLLEVENEETRIRAMQRPKISLHIKDLVSKLENARYFAKTLFQDQLPIHDTLRNISDIVNGQFAFEKEDKDFFFHKQFPDESQFKVRSVNTASGIKSFGILQLLLQANILDDRSLLIIDEPENHLHPKWQVEYARLIVELVKNEINVMVSSHSPYMIQALKFFSEKAGIKEKVNYYLAELDEKEGLSEIKDVTHDLNKIFLKLAEPLQDLVWKKSY